MAEVTQDELLEEAKKVLKANDHGSFTVPAGDLYPHQWLWDSCFVAIGLRHIDVKRAKAELTSLLRSMPWWIRIFEKLHLDVSVNLVRRDTRHVPPGQRMSNIEAMGYWAAIHRLRRKAYNSEALLSRSLFAVEDLPFNCMLVRANDLLQEIAHAIKEDLPQWLPERIAKTVLRRPCSGG
jgi:hypothetical protein